MAGLRWQVPPATAWEALAGNYRQRVEAGIVAIAQRWAPEIENYMKANARWTDRTGNLRAALNAKVEHTAGVMVEVILAHGLFYGWYLEGINPATMVEMQNAGEWNIINPTLDLFAPRIWADVRRMLS